MPVVGKVAEHQASKASLASLPKEVFWQVCVYAIIVPWWGGPYPCDISTASPRSETCQRDALIGTSFLQDLSFSEVCVSALLSFIIIHPSTHIEETFLT
jgi:hypothetical protein